MSGRPPVSAPVAGCAVLALLALGVLLDLLSLPPGPLPVLVLAADVPFLALIGGAVTRRFRLAAWIYGLLHFGVGLRWLGEVHPAQVAGAAVALSLVLVLAAIAIRAFVRRGLPYLLVVPTVLVFEEMLRTIWLGGMPWPSRSLAFAAMAPPWGEAFVASTAWFGSYALVFLAGLAGAAIAQLAPRLTLAFAPPPAAPRPALGLVAAVACAGTLFALGRLHLPASTSPAEPAVEIVAVQASIPQSLKHSVAPGANMRVLQAHLDLTSQALRAAREAGRRVDTVLWPETMIPWPFTDAELAHRFPDEWENGLRILQHVKEVAAEGDADTRYLLGAIYLFRRGDERHEVVYRYGTRDSLFFLDPALVPDASEVPPPPPALGTTPAFFLGRHDKHVLVPGGEYTPLGDVLPPLRMFRDFVSVIPPLDPGDRDQEPLPLTADPDGPRAGTVICFELLFPSRCRAWRRRGADVLVNAANYGWFGPTGFRAQIRAAAALRAAETGVRVLVAGNTGPTVFFDAWGRPHGRFVAGDGTVTERVGADDTTFRTGTTHGRLGGGPVDTLYTRTGDAPWWALGAALALVWGLRALRARRAPSPPAAGTGAAPEGGIEIL